MYSLYIIMSCRPKMAFNITNELLYKHDNDNLYMSKKQKDAIRCMMNHYAL